MNFCKNLLLKFVIEKFRRIQIEINSLEELKLKVDIFKGTKYIFRGLKNIKCNVHLYHLFTFSKLMDVSTNAFILLIYSKNYNRNTNIQAIYSTRENILSFF